LLNLYFKPKDIRVNHLQLYYKTNDEVIGNRVRTAVYAQWIPRNVNIAYANWNEGNQKKGEVDIVGISEAKQKPDWAVEVKWSNKPYANPSSELKSLETFMKKNSLSHAIVTSISETGKKCHMAVFSLCPLHVILIL